MPAERQLAARAALLLAGAQDGKKKSNALIPHLVAQLYEVRRYSRAARAAVFAESGCGWLGLCSHRPPRAFWLPRRNPLPQRPPRCSLTARRQEDHDMYMNALLALRSISEWPAARELVVKVLEDDPEMRSEVLRDHQVHLAAFRYQPDAPPRV